MIRKLDTGRVTESPPAALPHPVGSAATEKAAFLDYIHAFRGLAIFYIVAGHVILSFQWTDEPHIGRLLSIVFQNGSVYFIFIAGYLFQHLSGKYDYIPYLKSKAQNVILPYLVMSTPVVYYFTCVVRRWDIDASFYDQAVGWQVLDFYLTGRHITTYWFVPMIAVYYLASPLFVALDRHEKSYWLLPLGLALSLHVGRGESLTANCVHFFSVYWLGMLCSHYRPTVTRVVARLRPFLLLLALACIAAQLAGADGGPAINLIQKLAFCGLFLDLLRRCGPLAARWLSVFATLSFGIYFVHPYVIFALQCCANGLRGDSWTRSLAGSLEAGNLLLYGACLAAVLAGSAALVALGRCLFGRYSRMIMGS